MSNAQTIETSIELDRNFELYFDSLFKKFFSHLGVDASGDLDKTPLRFFKALKEMTSGYLEEPSKHLHVTFETESDDLVVIKQIPFSSLCEHHLMPFWGHVDVGYIPSGKVAGLSKFPRAVQALAHRLQIQERLTQQIRDTIQKTLEPLAVGVVVTATHSCMRCRGVRSTGSMTTSSLGGAFKTDVMARAEFFSILRGGQHE